LGASSDRSLARAAVPLAAALAVFLTAAGSSSVHALVRVGHPGRWAALVLLLAASARWAWDSRAALRVDPVAAGAAAFLVLLGVASSAWSVDPRLTYEKAVTFAVLVCVALLIAQAVGGRRDAAELVLAGLVAGAVAVALAGLLVLAVAHGDAVEVATTNLPPRFKGMGQDPNTSSLLFAIATPIAVWLVATARTARGRLVFGCATALLSGSIVASGSHGALVAATVGSGVVAALAARRPALALTAAATVAAVAAAGFWIETLPQPSSTNPPRTASATPAPTPKPGYTDAEINTPLDGELGIPLPGQSLRRHLTSSSGRTQAWGGAIRQAEQRPVAGYGFGTESRVFVDRWSTFTGGVPENSYVGIALQLGVAGLLAFAAVVVGLVRGARGQGRRFAAVGLGVLAAALAAAVGQSYVYSVGNVAALTVWIGAFLLTSRTLDA
jgi:O-antigen ligase/polysaccharide polymerase Wzy-like membrane protein